MPQSHPNRRDSWPPTIIRLFDEDLNTIPDDQDIDDNPFEYFLTSPEDITLPDADDFFSDLSAGIEGEEAAEEAVREISPSSLQRAALETEDDRIRTENPGQGYAVPMTLRDFTMTHEADRKSREQAHSGSSSQIPAPSSSASRGRRTVRLQPKPPGKGRGQTHSPRPRSWRGPSPDVWSIVEEPDIPGLSADEDIKEPEIEEVKAKAKPAKKQKRVHWAI